MSINTDFIIAFSIGIVIGLIILLLFEIVANWKNFLLIIGFFTLLCVFAVIILSYTTEKYTTKGEEYLTTLHSNVFNKETKYVFYSTTTDQHYISTSTEDYNNIKNTIGDKKVVDTLIVNGEYRILFADKTTLKVELKAPPSFKPNQEESLEMLKNVS